MSRLGVLTLVALAGCAIDDRAVEVHPGCVDTAGSGTISDFSSARLGRCPPEICSEAFYYQQAVALGESDPPGLIVPYLETEGAALSLGLTGDLSKPSDASSALRITLEMDSLGEPISERAGFALRFADCVDTSSYRELSFRVTGELEHCVELRFAAKWGRANVDARTPPCHLEECFADASFPAASGVTSIPLPDPTEQEDGASLTTLQWEAATPAEQPSYCNVDFTIDDLRLVP